MSVYVCVCLCVCVCVLKAHCGDLLRTSVLVKFTPIWSLHNKFELNSIKNVATTHLPQNIFPLSWGVPLPARAQGELVGFDIRNLHTKFVITTIEKLLNRTDMQSNIV